MSIPRRIEVLGLGGAKALQRAQDAATGAVAAMATVTAKVAEAAGYATAAGSRADDAEVARVGAETARNQATQIALGDAEVAFDGFLGARDLPATGADLSASTDGDQANGTDDTAALQARINADAAKGVPTRLRHGATYLVSDTITVPSNHVIDGRGALIQAKAGTNKPVLTNADRAGGNTKIHLKDLRLDGSGANQTQQFSVCIMQRVTHSTFENLDVQGGLRNQMFPNGTWGEGLVLIKSDYNQVLGGRFHHNSYDGLKLRGSNWNRIVSPLCDENGRSGIQISFYSPTGPPYNVGEGVEAEGSNHNTFLSPICQHSTGVPHATAPTTSGFYIHTGYRNTIIGLQVHGMRQGIGVYGGANDNEFNGGLIRINHVDRAAIDVEGGPGGLFRNSFKGITCRGLSGADGKHIRVTVGAAGAILNRFEDVYLARGEGSGTWSVDVGSGSLDSWFENVFNDGAWNDLGTNTQRRSPGTEGVPFTTGATRMRPATPAAPLVNSKEGNLYVDAAGFLCFMDEGGLVTKIKGGTFTLPDAVSLPAADATRRGMLRWVQGGAGVADQLYVCRKRADGNYEWAPTA